MNLTHPKKTISSKRGSTEMIWVGSITGVVILVGLTFLFFGSPVAMISSRTKVTPLPIGTPIHTLTFDDGSALQILNIGDAIIEDGVIVKKTKSSMFYSGSSGSSTTGMSGMGVQSSITVVTNDKQITRIQFESPPANLLIETRLLHPSNVPIESQRILWGSEIRITDHDDLDFPGWDTLLKSPEDDPNMPEVVVQLSDGAGGWINGCGPCSSSKDPEHRSMIAFNAWPRTTKELEFRAMRPGTAPVTWKMNNPSLLSKPEPWLPSPLPQMHSDTDFDLELKEAVKIEGHRMIQPQYKFISKVPGDTLRSGGGSNGFSMLDCSCEELLGAWGTRTERSYIKLPDDYIACGFPYPPDEHILRFRFVVKPTDLYPYPKSDTLIIAKAKVAADGISLEAIPKVVTGYGILSVEMNNVTTGDKGSFNYRIKGRWNNATEEAAGEAAIGRNNHIPVCFLDDAEVSTGAARSNSSGMSGTGNVTEYEYEGHWEGSLQPGNEISLGMTNPLPTREVFFTYEP